VITTDYLVISPAYERDFKSASAAIENFKHGSDWKMETPGHGGTYCSVRDFAKGVTVQIRYNKLAKVTNYTI
jgi:hypothetical protein